MSKRDIDRPVHLRITVAEELRRRLKVIAKMNDLSVSEFCRELLDERTSKFKATIARIRERELKWGIMPGSIRRPRWAGERSQGERSE